MKANKDSSRFAHPRQVLAFFFLAALILAGVQLFLFRHSLPSTDAIEYLEVSEQIKESGYVQALSNHWSPLYPLYLYGVRSLFGFELGGENWLSLVSYAVLILLGCALGAFFVERIRRIFWRRADREEKIGPGWRIYLLGLIFYFAFVIYKVNLRYPDALVFILATLLLVFWSLAIAERLNWKWAAAAGLSGGLGFLARTNLMHWSLVTGLAACALAPALPLKKRLAAFLAFLFPLLVIVAFQSAALSSQKGHLTLGAGKVPFAEIYGAVWKNGHPAWPERYSDGDVRLFTEKRELNFPYFYEPARELEDAVILFRFSAAFRGVLRAVFSMLFGFWSPAWGMMWPLLWAAWPIAWAGIRIRPGLGEAEIVSDRVGWFLIFAGLAGVGMHLASFCIGYYLPPYLLSLFAGLSLLSLKAARDKNTVALLDRAFLIAGSGFLIASVLTTFSFSRNSQQNHLKSGVRETAALTEALKNLHRDRPGLLKIAAGGEWLGLYAIRLSESQVAADLPNLDIFKDKNRLDRALAALREKNIRVLLAPAQNCLGQKMFSWKRVEGTGWCLLEF